MEDGRCITSANADVPTPSLVYGTDHLQLRQAMYECTLQM